MPITFKADNIRKILTGTKTQTRRTGKHLLKVGHTYSVKGNWYGPPPCHIKITRRFKQRLGDVSREDIQKEGYDSFEDFQAAWIKLHRKWSAEELVTVYEFKLEKGEGRRQARINGPLQKQVTSIPVNTDLIARKGCAEMKGKTNDGSVSSEFVISW